MVSGVIIEIAFVQSSRRSNIRLLIKNTRTMSTVQSMCRLHQIRWCL